MQGGADDDFPSQEEKEDSAFLLAGIEEDSGRTRNSEVGLYNVTDAEEVPAVSFKEVLVRGGWAGEVYFCLGMGSAGP